MLTGDESLAFINKRVRALASGKKDHQRAAYEALSHLAMRWAEPSELHSMESLQMAQRIDQDLADLIRHVQDIKDTYLEAAFEEEAVS